MILQFCMLYISFLWKPNENHAVIMLLKYVTFNMQTSTFANQCLSSLKLWVRILFIARCTRYNIMWQSLSVTCDRSVVFSTIKTDCHDIAEILLKVVLNTITLHPPILIKLLFQHCRFTHQFGGDKGGRWAAHVS